MICSWAFMIIASEVGRQCFPGQDPDFQAELADDVRRIDDYVARNGGATPAQIDAFKTKQGHVGDSKDIICRPDVADFYQALRSQKPEERRSMIDEMLARPGVPTWGTCT